MGQNKSRPESSEASAASRVIGKSSQFGTTVYKDVYNSIPVAVKIVRPLIRDGMRPQVEEMAVQLGQRAKHPNVVEFVCYTQREGRWITELMDENLDSYLSRLAGRLPRNKQIEVCWQMASGILFLHQQLPPVSHGNLHSRNVLVRSRGMSVIVKIGDLEHVAFRDHTTTRFSTDEDISALGRLMLEVAVRGSQQQQSAESTPSADVCLSKLPEDHPLKFLINKCLVRNPTDRPSISAEQVILNLVRVRMNDDATKHVLTTGAEISCDTFGYVSEGQLGRRKVHVRKMLVCKVHQSLSKQMGSETTALGVIGRLMDECRVWESLKHPNIVALHGAYKDEQSNCVTVVTEPVDLSLYDFCGKVVRQLTEAQQIDACLQISLGLMYMHQLTPQVLHRALTSSSIAVSENGSQFKIDYLAAQSRFQVSSISESPKGTRMPEDMAFLSPECLKEASAAISDKSDMFSLGVVMLNIATQMKVPACATLEDLAERHMLFSSMLDEAHCLRPLILECLQEDPQLRPPIERVVFCLRKLHPNRKQMLLTDLGCPSLSSSSNNCLVSSGTIGRKDVMIKKLCVPVRSSAVRQGIRGRQSYRQPPANSGSSEDQLRNVTDSMKSLEKLKHPHLAEVIGIFSECNNPHTIFVVMEKMNQNLETFLDGCRGVLSEDKQTDLSLQITSGILSLHQNKPQFCHGRLHVGNILLNVDGSVAKVSDHGCSKLPISLSKIRDENAGYLPPEFPTDPEPNKQVVASMEMDVYSLGTLMLQVATQSSPRNFAAKLSTPTVEADEMEGIDQDQLENQDEAMSLEDHPEDIVAHHLSTLPSSHRLKPLIAKCLAKDPKERPLIEQVLISLAKLRSGGLSQFLHLEDTLGYCSYGTTYRARLGRKLVTVKKIRRSLIDKSHNRDTFALLKEECKTWEGMNHPNIIKVLGLYTEGAEEETIVLVLEYLSFTLTKFLQDRKGDLSTEEKVDICLQMASGVMYLHQHNPKTIHCKLHDRNVLLDQHGTVVKITDPLPAMQIHSQERSEVKPSTRVSAYSSKPERKVELSAQELYHPPECLKDPPLYTAKGDVYSLGLALFKVSRQDPSPKLGSIQELVERRSSNEVLLSDTALDKLTARCLQQNPDMRPTSESTYLQLIKLSSKEGVADGIVKYADLISRGSYGSVYKGTLGSRQVAVKHMKEVLEDYASASDVSKAKMINSFEDECELLETARHPNVVECIGLYRDLVSPGKPLLLMELMAMTLEMFLKDSLNCLLSTEKKLDICFQIASGLHFLHYHSKILHRDLTARNVLLSADHMTVKISDFGQAKFRPLDQIYFTSKTPGCVLYMPPEAFDTENPTFNRKGDVFAFGVLLIYIGSQKKPDCGIANIGCTKEVVRRAKDLQRLPEGYPLMDLIFQCLKDDHSQRPDCEQVLNELWGAMQKVGLLYFIS